MPEKISQPEIVAKKTPLLGIDGYVFKDLNKNGMLEPYEDWRLPVEARVTDLVSRMTLEEKAGMMVHPWISIGPGGQVVEEKNDRFSISTSYAILAQNIRHFLNNNVVAPELMAQWANDVQSIAESSPLGIPLNISSDPRHHMRPHDMRSHFEGYTVDAGKFSAWPEFTGLAAANDPNLVKEFGKMAAREYRAVGIHTALHPQADLATEPRWPRINGTFGEDAELAARMVKAYIEGFQGKSLTSTSVICMTKHWPGGGPQENGTDPHNAYGKMQVYSGGYFDYHLKPFLGALEVGTAAIMPYYGIPQGYDTVGMSFSSKIIAELLRKVYRYDGVVCTDWGVTRTMPWGVENLTVKQRYQRVVEAGCDQIGGEAEPRPFIELVEDGAISETRLTISVKRLLRNMYLLGLFENPYVEPDIAGIIIGNAESLQASMAAQHKSVVLLKNKDSCLPLQSGIKLYIPPDVPGDVNQLEGKTASRYGQIVNSPSEADAAIIKVKSPYQVNPEAGMFAFHEGTLAYEGADNSYFLTLIKDTVREMSGKPVIVSIYMDRPAILSEFVDSVDGLLVTFGVSDSALLDVIFGRFNPVGKIPFNLPRDMASVIAHQPDVPHGVKNPLFKFGFGLSYRS